MSKSWIAAAIMSLSLAAAAQQTELRLNPTLGDDMASAVLESAEYPPFVNSGANVIQLNGADWSRIGEAFARADSSVVHILHIGDSHIQAEGSTSRTRMHLQAKYGSAGRGVTAPLKLAGTNAPVDYSYKSGSAFSSSRLLKTPWTTDMGFSGVAIKPSGKNYELEITCGEPFDRLIVYSLGESTLDVDAAVPDVLAGYISPATGVTDVLLTEPVTKVNIKMRGEGAVTAVELLRGDKGVEYSAIGNNGATFSNYNGVPGFGEAVERLAPDMIIISLGTNEAFGRITNAEMTAQIHKLVETLREHNPDAVLLLTTPQECYRRTSVRRGKGRKRRTVRSYSVNTNIERMRNLIKDYATGHGIALYDWYEVAGGAGSAAKWLGKRLMNTDRIHLTWDGYHLMGDMFYEALQKQIDTINTDNINGDESVR